MTLKYDTQSWRAALVPLGASIEQALQSLKSHADPVVQDQAAWSLLHGL